MVMVVIAVEAILVLFVQSTCVESGLGAEECPRRKEKKLINGFVSQKLIFFLL